MSGGGRKYLYLDFMPFAIGGSMGWAITQDMLLPSSRLVSAAASGSPSRLALTSDAWLLDFTRRASRSCPGCTPTWPPPLWPCPGQGPFETPCHPG